MQSQDTSLVTGSFGSLATRQQDLALRTTGEMAVPATETVAINDENHSLYKFYKSRKNRRSASY
ncbi:MAG TPA: hypothetical protein V6C76_06725 [Drouetiella sp.]